MLYKDSTVVSGYFMVICADLTKAQVIHLGLVGLRR